MTITDERLAEVEAMLSQHPHDPYAPDILAALRELRVLRRAIGDMPQLWAYLPSMRRSDEMEDAYKFGLELGDAIAAAERELNDEQC